jgi:hypothetical protein
MVSVRAIPLDCVAVAWRLYWKDCTAINKLSLMTISPQQSQSWDTLIAAQLSKIFSTFSPHPEDGVGLVPKRGCLLTLAYYTSPDDMSLESDGGMICWQGKTEELGEKPVPVPLYPPKIPHWLIRARTQASAVRGRRLTTWGMARPFPPFMESEMSLACSQQTTTRPYSQPD